MINIALDGPSGAGKSTFINTLFPTLTLETGELSHKLERGKNTTRTTELFSKFIGLNEPLGMDEEAYIEEDPEYDDGDDEEEPIVLSPRVMKDFLEMIGADTSDFPEEEELDRLDAIRVAEMISQNFIDPNKQGKYKS